MNTTADKLHAQVEFPDPWKPHDGSPATLVGRVVAETAIPYKDRNGGEQTCPAFVVRDESGKEWTAATFHRVLRNELLEHDERGKLEPGDWVAIHYRGLKVGETGTEYHGYRVAVERPSIEEATGDFAEGY
jgi:hypothetical protein